MSSAVPKELPPPDAPEKVEDELEKEEASSPAKEEVQGYTPSTEEGEGREHGV